ncbi:modulator of macroautophagy TMEM150B [Austrofundulus limnaeus]|uniref:Modulator of macroautophagy TMEM150B n=1 Tax=Austrofundulus limnaeus TaxID=52670 RepID=A0A2I4B3J7_AUSLI|nr:PREDICTED: transmembrane protein 150B [Austrofundulus limnaeus]
MIKVRRYLTNSWSVRELHLPLVIPQNTNRMWVFVLLPIITAILGIGGAFTVFAVSVANGSVNLTKGVPYISECAGYPPQSSIFTQLYNIVTVLIIVIMAVRYQQVADFGYRGRANVAGFWLGFLSAIGLSVTTNFQASVSFELHVVGACVAFTLVIHYFWIQMYLTYRAEPSVDRPWVGPVRFTLCILCSIFLLGRILSPGESHQQVYLSQNGRGALGSAEHGAEQENTWELRENKHFQRKEEEEEAG